jgi:S1-C subfamily serine protease
MSEDDATMEPESPREEPPTEESQSGEPSPDQPRTTDPAWVTQPVETRLPAAEDPAAGVTGPLPGADEAYRWPTMPSTPSQPEPPRRRRALAAVVAALVLVSAGIGIGWGLGRGGDTSGNAGAPLTAAPQVSPSTGQAAGGLDSQAIADKVDPAIVDINTTLDADPFDSTPALGRGAGTGMIVTSSGEVLTNNHVVEGASRIDVTIAGRSGTYVADFIGADTAKDIALLQIEGVSGLPTVTLADSSNLSVGQGVVAIGNALGRGGDPAVTEGSVTDVGQSITVSDGHGGTEQLNDVIQTDAQIQPGDSGGALVNSAGQVVGVITAGSRDFRDQSETGFGFAIQSNNALDVVNEIRAGHEGGSIVIGPAGYVGVGAKDLDQATANRLNVSSGVLVSGVTAGTPAARAGITEGSVITAINGEHIASVDELGPAIHRHAPGEQISVTWVDQGGTHTATLRLVSGPAA